MVTKAKVKSKRNVWRKPGCEIIDCNLPATIPTEWSPADGQFVPRNWTIEEHKKNGVLKCNNVTSFISEEQKTEDGYISFENIKKRIAEKKLQSLNCIALDFFKKNQSLIPKSWEGKVVVFLGTIYLAPNGQPYVRALESTGDRFVEVYLWAKSGFGEKEIFAVASDK